MGETEKAPNETGVRLHSVRNGKIPTPDPAEAPVEELTEDESDAPMEDDE
jgi:hypothetical protein